MQSILKSRTKLIAILLAIAFVSLMLVGLNAYSSQLQYEINSVNSAIQESNYKIATLEVKIKSATNVANLEDRALAMGLVYPGFDNIVYLHESQESMQDFATALRQNAYN